MAESHHIQRSVFFFFFLPSTCTEGFVLSIQTVLPFVAAAVYIGVNVIDVILNLGDHKQSQAT